MPAQNFKSLALAHFWERSPFPWEDQYLHLLLLHLFNGLFFQDNLGNSAPEKQNHSGKTNLGLLEQEIVSGSGISWDICKYAPRLIHITLPAPHHSVFYRPDALPATQSTASKHWRLNDLILSTKYLSSVVSLHQKPTYLGILHQ